MTSLLRATSSGVACVVGVAADVAHLSAQRLVSTRGRPRDTCRQRPHATHPRHAANACKHTSCPLALRAATQLKRRDALRRLRARACWARCQSGHRTATIK